jgi:SNF2 family DNA or RNA helicase
MDNTLTLQKVDEIIGDEQKERTVTKLHEILRPFLLRRVKKDVLFEVPPKMEIVVYCGMTNLQVKYLHTLFIHASLVTFLWRTSASFTEVFKEMPYEKHW